jgi:hypothetical protein
MTTVRAFAQIYSQPKSNNSSFSCPYAAYRLNALLMITILERHAFERVSIKLIRERYEIITQD